uniref:Uncharacterized protein n=1 Tax=Arundo donax TaxID=35708 RepID=A0A0A9HCM8_ARUDO
MISTLLVKHLDSEWPSSPSPVNEIIRKAYSWQGCRLDNSILLWSLGKTAGSPV